MIKCSLVSIALVFGQALFLQAQQDASFRRIGTGSQPQVTVDANGIVNITWGRSDSIFYATSTNGGASFSAPKFVATLKQMHLGMTRGPQIASSLNYSMITAMDKAGNLYSFLLRFATGKWEKIKINDVNDSAPEGLMALAADKQDNFYAVWLDLRKDSANNIYFSSFQKGGKSWAKNRVVYTSPDEHVCECCKPSLAVSGSKVAVMFRNWVNGSRDLYTIVSENKGQHFSDATKMGEGTWKLKGCPMDGGGIAFDDSGAIHTVWRREAAIYYCRPQQKEVMIGNGKICSIHAGHGKVLIALQDAGSTKLVDVNRNAEVTIGKGAFIKSVFLPDAKVIAVWENEGEIRYRLILPESFHNNKNKMVVSVR